MAQKKNSIFVETSKKNKDGIINIPIDIGKITTNIGEWGFSSAFLSRSMLKMVIDRITKQPNYKCTK